MKSLLAQSAALVLASLMFAAPAMAQTDPAHPRTISVSGESSDRVAPNRAILSMSLVSKDKKLAVAKKANDELTSKLVAITTRFGIPKDKISTSGMYIAPEYSYNNQTNRQQFEQYTVNRSLRVTMDDITVNEKLLSAIVDAGVDQVGGVEFTLSNPENYSMPLRVKAFADAKARAEALAQAAGGKLGPALTIVSGETPAVMPPPRPMMPMMMSAKMAAPSEAPSLPGMVDLHESVNVTFALE